MKCVARTNHTKANPQGEACGKECEVGYKYCEEHKGRKKAVEERMQKSVQALNNTQNQPINFDEVKNSEELEEEAPKREVVPVVNDTSHKGIIDQVNAMLGRVVDWEFAAFNEVNKLEPAEWRYRDKAGAEQIRGEVAIYERAQDRSLRALTQITKLGIEQQAAIVEKAQYEGVRTAIHRTLVRMGFDEQQISAALRILAEEFSNLVR